MKHPPLFLAFSHAANTVKIIMISRGDKMVLHSCLMRLSPSLGFVTSGASSFEHFLEAPFKKCLVSQKVMYTRGVQINMLKRAMETMANDGEW